jgi:hypothetical protein
VFAPRRGFALAQLNVVSSGCGSVVVAKHSSEAAAPALEIAEMVATGSHQATVNAKKSRRRDRHKMSALVATAARAPANWDCSRVKSAVDRGRRGSSGNGTLKPSDS